MNKFLEAIGSRHVQTAEPQRTGWVQFEDAIGGEIESRVPEVILVTVTNRPNRRMITTIIDGPGDDLASEDIRLRVMDAELAALQRFKKAGKDYAFHIIDLADPEHPGGPNLLQKAASNPLSFVLLDKRTNDLPAGKG